jgi:hypothetical protein
LTIRDASENIAGTNAKWLAARIFSECLGIPPKVIADSEGRRSAFRNDSGQPSERSDAGAPIVEEVIS